MAYHDNALKLDYNDVLMVPQRSSVPSRKDINLLRQFNFDKANIQLTAFPLIIANLDTTGTFKMAQAFAEYVGDMQACPMVALHKFYDIDEIVEAYQYYPDLKDNTIYTMGISDEDISKVYKLYNVLPKLVCIDVANAYTGYFRKRLEQIKGILPNDTVIMAGNVCTPSIVEDLILNSGVDIVKIGIGPGALCTTRLKTGCGYPQFSAVVECAHAAHGVGGYICADGGCVTPGDIAKAYGAGADFVMVGSMFAGTDECEGEWEWKYDNGHSTVWLNEDRGKQEYGYTGEKRLKTYGMSSEDAMKKHYGGVAKHRASEGRTVYIPHKGSSIDILKDIMGGVRSACTYIGATKIKDMPKCAHFIRCNSTHNNSLERFS